MLSKSHTVSGGYSKKKKAPPRPPPPTAVGNNIRGSQSFRTAGELQSQKISSFGQRPSYSVDNNGQSSGTDLIDFSTPPETPASKLEGVGIGMQSKEPADYMYRVGASIFYIRSQLKHPAPSSQAANPFSPPRPSAQAMMASPAKQAASQQQGYQSTLYSNVPAQQSQQSGSTKYKPTIIKRANEKNNNTKSVVGGSNNTNDPFKSESTRSSSGSSDWSDYSHTSSKQQQRYGNIPTAWDEPPEQHRKPPLPAVMATIIKPVIATKPSLAPKPTTLLANRGTESSTTWTGFSASNNKLEVQNNVSHVQRNYYDDPPDSEFDEDEDQDDSYVSPPMPIESPPPPPPDVALNEWVDSTADVQTTYVDSTYTSHNVNSSETDRAYAIALYDYFSDVEGDLTLQVGDLVYLIKKIDDEWLYGQCAGIEGMFPSNYVNVVVPLADNVEEMPQPLHEHIEETPSVGNSAPQSNQIYFADALYKFDAEAEGDLSLRPGDMVKIFGRLNEDWLYGEVAGSIGQFPATFVEPVPLDLPIIPTAH